MNIYRKHRNAHTVGWSIWHFQWCTKYRRKVFCTTYLKNLCEILLKEIISQEKFKLVDLEVDFDHIHVVVSIPLTITPIQAIKTLKGVSSRALFLAEPKRFSAIYWKRSIWSSGKFIASVGHITIEKAKQYLETHHAKY